MPLLLLIVVQRKLGLFEDGVLARIQVPLLLLIVVQRKSYYVILCISSKEGNGSYIITFILWPNELIPCPDVCM